MKHYPFGKGAVGWLLGMGCLVCLPTWAQTPTPLEEITFSGDIHQVMPFDGGGTVFGGDDAIFVFDPATGTANAFNFIGNQPQAGLDGYAQSPPGCSTAQWYSLDAIATRSGVTYRRADVFHLFGGMLLDSRAAGVPDGVNVDAISIDPVSCDLVFSIDIVASLGGVVYKPDDLIRWNGTAFSPYHRPGFGLNIDALHIIDETRFLYSIESGGVVPGLAVQDDDIIESIRSESGSIGGVTFFIYDQVLAFSPRVHDSSWIAADVVALSAKVGAPLGDQIFADGFEE